MGTMTQFDIGERVRILPLDYLKPCLQGKTGAIEDITRTPSGNLYSVRLDHPDPISCPVVEAGEFERLDHQQPPKETKDHDPERR